MNPSKKLISDNFPPLSNQMRPEPIEDFFDKVHESWFKKRLFIFCNNRFYNK